MLRRRDRDLPVDGDDVEARFGRDLGRALLPAELSYSPELNPDEMANADLKQAVTEQAPARTKLLVKVNRQAPAQRSTAAGSNSKSTSSMDRFAMRLDYKH